MIAGLETQADGHVRFGDQDWTQLKPAARSVGYVFQDARLFPHLSVARNLTYGARRRATPTDRVDAVIEALDLAPLLDRAPRTLSGGEARRVALGRAMASGPRILLLDEPLTGLDRARKADLMPYIARVVAGFGVPALYVTHAQGEIDFLADRTLSMAGGRLQGWSPATPRLTGAVVEARPGHLRLAMGDVSIWLTGTGRVGETWAIPLGQGFLLTAQAPGHSNAALTMAGQVDSFDAGRCRVRVAGQTLDLPWRGAEDFKLAPGQPIWLSLATVQGRLVATR